MIMAKSQMFCGKYEKKGRLTRAATKLRADATAGMRVRTMEGPIVHRKPRRTRQPKWTGKRII